MHLKKLFLYASASTVTAFGIPNLVLGQDQESAANEAEIDEIVVTGIRGSLQKSLDIKKDSDSIVDVITAEDIGKFPDKNVAESLQRVPGVTIQRQWGEGAAVSVRGAGEDLTLTTLNGQNVASTGWFVFEPARRSFNYSLLPSELVGNVKVYKSPQADLPEGGVGGTVMVETRKPLDLDSGVAFASLEAQYSGDSGETEPSYSGLISWKNADETFGVLAAYAGNDRSLQRQGNEAFWQWGAGPVSFRQDRERSAADITLQYAPNDTLDVSLHLLNLEMGADNTNYAMWLTQADVPWAPNPTNPNTAFLPADASTPIGGPLNVAFYQMRPREANMTSDTLDFELNYQGDGYHVHFQIGNTEATGGTDFETVFDDGSGGTPISGGTFDFTGGVQTWNLSGFDLANYDPGTLNMGTGGAFNRTPKEDKEDYLQLDVEFDIDWGAVNSVKVGFKSTSHEVNSRKFNFTIDPAAVTTFNTSSYQGGLIEAGTANMSIPQFNDEALKDAARSLITGEVEDEQAFNQIEEDNTALYFMFTYEGDNVRGNFGARYIQTDATALFYIAPNSPVSSLSSATADYSEFLPSINMAYDLSDETILRASYAKVLSRPQYVDMYMAQDRSGVDPVIPNSPTLITGNVGLDPFIADQIDIAYEKYLSDLSMYSIGVFTKNIKSFVSFTTTGPVFINDPEDPDNWLIQQKNNGVGGDINGIEIQYQRDLGNGFGGLINFTHAKTDTDEENFDDRNDELTDSSGSSYNLVGFYENDQIQARVAYNWRDSYIMREVGAYGNRLHDDYGTLDASLLYELSDTITLKFEGINLTNEQSFQIGNNDLQAGAPGGGGFSPGFPLYQYDLGRRFFIGANFKLN